MYNLHLNETDAEAVFNVVLFVTVFIEFGFTKRVDRVTTTKVFGNLTFRALALRQSEIPPDEGLTVENESASKPFRVAIRPLSPC